MKSDGVTEKAGLGVLRVVVGGAIAKGDAVAVCDLARRWNRGRQPVDFAVRLTGSALLPEISMAAGIIAAIAAVASLCAQLTGMRRRQPVGEDWGSFWSQARVVREFQRRRVKLATCVRVEIPDRRSGRPSTCEVIIQDVQTRGTLVVRVRSNGGELSLVVGSRS